MGPNPWRRLPAEPPFVLPEDKEKVEDFNQTAHRKHSQHWLDLRLIPMPFLGREDAPVVLLGNISGTGDECSDDYSKWPIYANRLRKNLIHGNQDCPFLPLGPTLETFPSHKEWWTEQLKHLLDSFGNGPEAESVLGRALLEVVFFPYRSHSDKHAHDCLSVTSQEYSRSLVFNAMRRKAAIVVRYGKQKWFGAVRGLENYEALYLLKGNLKTRISPNGFRDPAGYQKVVDKIKASLT